MSVKSEIMEMLRNGVTVRDIRMKFRSKSMLYECLTDYLLELTDKVEEIKTTLQQEQTKLLETRTTHEELAIERNGLERNKKALIAEKESLADEVKSPRKEHDGLSSGVAELEARGFTSEIVAKLKTAYDKDGVEVDALARAN